MEAHNASNEVEFENVEAGDTIAWTEEWGSGEKQFSAEVVEIETEHYRAELTRPACDKAHLVLDVSEGQDELEDMGATVDDNGNHSISMVIKVE